MPHRQARPAHNDMPGTAKSRKHNNRSRSCESPAAPPTANTGLAWRRLRKTRQFADSLTEHRPPGAKLRALACLIVFKLEAWVHRASQQRPRAARRPHWMLYLLAALFLHRFLYAAHT